MSLRLLVVLAVISLTSCQTVRTLPNSNHLTANFLSECLLVDQGSDSGQYSSYSLQCANLQVNLLGNQKPSIKLEMKTNVNVECVISLQSTSSHRIFEQTLIVQANNQQKEPQTRQVEIPLGNVNELASANFLQVLFTPQEANGEVIINEVRIEDSSRQEAKKKTKQSTKLIANYTPKVMIDLFSVESNPLFLVVDGHLPLVGNMSISDDFALGGNRKIFLAVESGTNNDYISSEVIQNSWSSSSPESCSGFASVIYDGINSRNVYVNPTGLGCMDFTDSGSNAFEIEASSSIETRFKLSLFGDSTQSTFSFSVDSRQGSYLISYDDLQGNVDLHCVGAVQVIASVASFGEVRVNSISIGAYHPSPSSTPSRTPSKSYMILSGPTNIPPPPHWGSQCAVNSDCARYETVCSTSSCDNGICISAPRSIVGCCSIPVDCPPQEACESICVDNYCEYSNCESESLIHPQPHPNPNPSNNSVVSDGQSFGWVIGVVLGGVGGVLLVGVVALLCLTVLVKRRHPSAQRIYNDMLGELQ